MGKISTLFLLLPLLFIFSCENEPDKSSFRITGRIDGMPLTTITLKEINSMNSPLVDSVMSKADGTFAISGTSINSGLYTLSIGSKHIIIVLDNNEVKIKANWNDLNNLKIVGSPASSSINDFNNQFENFSQHLISIESEYNGLKTQNAPDSVLLNLQINSAAVYDSLLKFVKNFADTTRSLPVAIYASSYLIIKSDDLIFLKKLSPMLNKRFEISDDNFLFANFEERINERIAYLEAHQSGPAVGTKAPDFKARTMNGDSITLSSFRGRYVLLDFWASWCPPCRVENENVVIAFDKFKNQRFTVLGFSLDGDQSKWQSAVTKDKLNWTQISDFSGWKSPIVKQYGVDVIPMNYLINPDGEIIGRNLRGNTLKETLNCVLSESEGEDKYRAETEATKM